MPCRPRHAAVTAACAVVLVMTGCARHPAGTAAMPPAPAAGARYGTIAAMRPAALAPPMPTAPDVRMSILRAIGPAPAGAAVLGSGPPVEFIIRADDGGTLSVVQGDADQFRPGERVAVSVGAPTRLVRIAAAP